MSKQKLSWDKQTICTDCAEELGGVWPEGHLATMWNGVCDYCNKETTCCSIGDWNWKKENFKSLRD
jgi:hypothetical protein